jgi:hypothetical protein
MNGGVEKPYPPNEGFSLGASDQEQTGESKPDYCYRNAFSLIRKVD